MKPVLAIVCVEDETDVLESVVRDLEIFEDDFSIETATSVNEAERILLALQNEGIRVALFICDHLMPGVTGVEFLVRLQKIPEYTRSEKMLLTGQAGLLDTVKAVNEAGLNYYLAKPWNTNELQSIVKKLLTDYVIANKTDVLRYFSTLDAERLSDSLRSSKHITDM
jgi:response regulator RpfG family c-di-GMP phosphodiesterase